MRRDDGDVRCVVELLGCGVCFAAYAAGANAREHDALGAGGDRGVEQRGVHVLVRVEDVDLGKGRGVGHVEDDAADGLGGREEKVRDLVDEDAELACFRAREGVEAVCVVLGRVKGRADAVVQHNHGASVAAGGGSREDSGLVEVQRPIGGEGGRGPHGADADDGFGRVDGGFEEEGRFLEGVGPVGDDNARDLRLCEFLVD